ncbi:MAG: DMT family transporter [Gammaproteobacteria bacterium]|nr:DMT family transporter [Gammaproteobacteria bacterium]
MAVLLSTPVLYIATVSIWGVSWFAIRFQLGVVPPELSIVYRFGMAAVIMVVFCLWRGESMRFSPRDHFFIALQGIFLFSTNYLVFYWASATLTSGLIAVIFSTIVFMNMLNAAIFFGQKTTQAVIVGAGLGLVGIVLIFWPELAQLSRDRGALVGLGLSFLGTFMASLGNMASVRNQKQAISVLQSNAYGMLYGTVFLLVYVFWADVELTYDERWPYSVSLVFLSLFATVLGFGAYLTLLGRIGPDRAAYATVLFPVVALSVSTLFEGYEWSVPAGLGVALVLLGNALIIRKTV